MIPKLKSPLHSSIRSLPEVHRPLYYSTPLVDSYCHSSSTRVCFVLSATAVAPLVASTENYRRAFLLPKTQIHAPICYVHMRCIYPHRCLKRKTHACVIFTVALVPLPLSPYCPYHMSYVAHPHTHTGLIRFVFATTTATPVQ